MKKITLITTLFLLFSIGIYGQCKLETKRITVFKDATAYIEKEGICDNQEKVIQLALPYQESPSNTSRNYSKNTYVENNIILGTIDIKTPGNKILSKHSTNVKSKSGEPLGSISEIFRKNIGKEIELDLKNQNTKTRGVLYTIDNTTNSFRSQNPQVHTIGLKQGNTWKLINISEIDQFRFIDEPVLSDELLEKALSVKVEKESSNQKVNMSYLRKGITWTPGYSVSLLSSDKLKISLNANVLNDVEDMTNTKLNLAVGIPVFRFSTVGAPLVSNDRVIDIINKINNPNTASTWGQRNNINSQSEISIHNFVNKEAYGSNSSPSEEEEDDGDIFLYEIDNVSMQIGDRTNFEITAFESNYEDVYVVDMKSNEYESYNYGNNKKKGEEPTNVWHSIKFRNNADVPLTTGSVFFKKYNAVARTMTPISQERLDYTPVGETCIVKMAVAPNIIVQQSEREISRQKDTIVFNSSYGYLIEVEGEFEFINLKNEEINMLVNRNIRAIHLIESTEEWATLRSYRYLFERNQTNEVQWNFKIGPNDKKTITYKYIVYRPR